MAFEVEDIPGDAVLFLRVHKNQFVPSNDPTVKRPSSACFKHLNMSVNWAKYSTAAETAKASSAAVVSFISQECKSLQQTVIHCPIQEGDPDGPNQAHSEVRGEKSQPICDKFVRFSKLVWIRNPAAV
jgi:hypothetical protein